MLIRYQTSDSGKRKKLAEVYTRDEHGIGRERIAHEALTVTRRLERAGHQAYIVGGAVRDLLIGISPKDYDIATDAHPRHVRKLFRRSRIIGKRFQLVHVYVQESILEVATFRALPDEDADHSTREANNLFGTMAEDVKRRDFTMNALYYDPKQEQIVDYVGGVADIRQKRVRVLNPAETSFAEDPVRMIRAIRYAATTGFKIPGKVSRTIRRMSDRLANCPISRLTEEMFKMLACGHSADCFRAAHQHGVLGHLLPTISGGFDSGKGDEVCSRLASIDAAIQAEQDPGKSRMLAAMCEPFMTITDEVGLDLDLYRKELFRMCKQVISPLTPPNADVGKAVEHMMMEHGLQVPKRRRRKPKRRRSIRS